MSAQSLRVATAHGELAYVDSGGPGAALLFVHGNSSCKEIFAKQLESPLLARHRRIAFDLPGHGESANAPDPSLTYSIHGFADAAIALLEALRIERAIVVGWSLGGHIALELLARWPGCVSAWITGTPPTGANDLSRAFLQSPHMELTFKESFSADEARAFAQEAVAARVKLEPWMYEACRRADGRFRPLMLASALAGRDLDGRAIAESSPLPLAVVSGELEPFVDNAFLGSLAYRNLWDARVHVLAGLAHTPFWEAPETLNPLLARFVDESAREQTR
ncbi:MAG: alpha/beta hydrolase [Myxococcota bacterium]